MKIEGSKLELKNKKSGGLTMNGSDPMTAGGNGAGVLDLKKIFQSAWIYRLLRIAISVVFIWSGISKLIAPKEFAVIIDSYGLVPEAWILPLAIILPLLEMIFGLGLLLDIKGSLAGITGLLMLFVVILSYGIWLGLDVDCGCFGPQDLESEAFHSLRPALFRDFAMIGGVIYLYFWRYYRSIKPVRLMFIFNKLLRRGGMIDAHD
jgi:uncharacterized membrane protein YphA (DoxX/SURF4 family)